MIPIRDAVPSPTRPLVTRVLVAATATIAVASSLSQTDLFGSIIRRTGGPDLVSWLLVPLALVQPLDWFQAIAAMTVLWIFGRTVEDRLGHGRFALLYVGCAVAAGIAAADVGGLALTSVILAPGAVAGVIGAHIALYPKSRILMLIPVARGLDVSDVPSVFVAGLWVVAHLASGLTVRAWPPEWSPRLALVPVVAGMLVGSLAGRALRRPERMRVQWWSP